MVLYLLTYIIFRVHIKAQALESVREKPESNTYVLQHIWDSTSVFINHVSVRKEEVLLWSLQEVLRRSLHQKYTYVLVLEIKNLSKILKTSPARIKMDCVRFNINYTQFWNNRRDHYVYSIQKYLFSLV